MSETTLNLIDATATVADHTDEHVTVVVKRDRDLLLTMNGYLAPREASPGELALFDVKDDEGRRAGSMTVRDSMSAADERHETESAAGISFQLADTTMTVWWAD